MESGSIVESWLMSNLFSCCRRYYMSGLLANRLEDNRRQSFILFMNTKQICNKSKWLKNIGFSRLQITYLSLLSFTTIQWLSVMLLLAGYRDNSNHCTVLTIEDGAVGPIKAVSGEWCMVTETQSLSRGDHQTPDTVTSAVTLCQTHVTHFISIWHNTG